MIFTVILQNPYKLKGKTAYFDWTNCEFEILYKKQIKLSENNIIAYYGTDNDANYVVVKSTDGSILHSIMKFW